MTKKELKKKCTERAKIFQQAMESCHSSSPMDCIEWFADRIAELESDIEARKFAMAMSENVERQLREENKLFSERCNQLLKDKGNLTDKVRELEKENTELKEHHKSVCESLTNTHRNIREQLTKVTLFLEDVYKIAMNDWTKQHDQVLRKVGEYLKEIRK